MHAIAGNPGSSLAEPTSCQALRKMAKKVEFFVAWVGDCGASSSKLREIIDRVACDDQNDVKIPR
jgi:hypothetical protein